MVAKTLLLARASWKRFSADNCTQMAAAGAYYALFAIVPLTVLTVSVLGIIFGSDYVQERITLKMTDYLDTGVGDVTFEVTEDARTDLEAAHGPAAVSAIDRELERLNADPAAEEERHRIAVALNDGESVTIAGVGLNSDELDVTLEGAFADAVRSYTSARGGVPIISFAFLLLSSTAVFAAVNRSLNYIWKARALRPLVQQKLFDLAMLCGAGLLLLGSLVASGVVASLRGVVEDSSSSTIGGAVWGLLLFIVPFSISFAFCLFSFRFVPQAKNKLRDVWPGALLAAVGFEALKFGYTFYVAHFSNYDVAYGAFGGVFMLLFFTYIAFYLFYLGAEVAFVFPDVREGTYVEQPHTAGKQARGRGPLAALGGLVAGLFVSTNDD